MIIYAVDLAFELLKNPICSCIVAAKKTVYAVFA